MDQGAATLPPAGVPLVRESQGVTVPGRVPNKWRITVDQFYLLSVLSNIVAGLTLAGDYLGDRIKLLASFKNLRQGRPGQVAVGLVTLAVGAIIIFVRAPGDTVPVAGDLLPALAGLAQGLAVLVEAFRKDVEGRGPQGERISRAVVTFRVPAGIAGAAIGILHFLFPTAVLL